MVNDLLKRRRALALKIAEALEKKWPNLNMEGFDTDEAAVLIDQHLPLTYAEADAEYDAAPDKKCRICGGLGSIEEEDGVWICPCYKGSLPSN